MEDWTFNQTLSGVPQGGLVSPILSNILLNKLDKFVETVLIPKYTRGEKRRQNPEYHQLKNKSQRRRQRGNVEEAEALRKQMQSLPSVDTDDPEYRRLKYVRYADDFLLGFIGPKSEAEEIKQELRKFLQEELKLELSEEKTLITHARDEAARFLGYEVVLLQDDQKRYKFQDGKDRRSINGRIGLRVPKDILETKYQCYQKGSKVMHRAEMEHESDFTIISTYQLEFRGIANYYQLAYNMHTLKKLKWIMEISLTKTLAHKFKMSVAKVYKRYGTELMVKDKKRKGLQVSIPRQDKDPLVATWGGVPLTWDIKATLEEQPPKVYHGGHSELVQRLLAGYCELCGSTENIEVHHIRALKDLHTHPGREKPGWIKRMIILKRKTMPLCRTCHDDVHAGRQLRRQTIELVEVKALQKKARL
jgi:hypothetical protein